tara:strand:- start:134 stop:1660 length:1527 start_codon:yes stop_codon:yes gene_type:complete
MSERKIKSIISKIDQTSVYDVAINTPLKKAKILSKKLNNKIFIKREDLQPVFSFKLRGAYCKIKQLTKLGNLRKIITASAGNHAQGVALSASKLGIKSLIVMPTTTPKIKINSVKNLGAEVILHGDAYDDAYEYAIRKSEKEGIEFIHPYDDIDVIAGQGTIARELLQQSDSQIDYIFIPVGGGGLLAGIAAYFKKNSPKTKIVTVEPEDSNCFQQAFRDNKRTKLKSIGIFADGVAVRQIGKIPFEISRDIVDSTILVNTDEICSGIKDLYDETRTVAEPAGALSIAGIKKFIKLKKLSKKNIVGIFCGANMNFDRLRHVSERSELGELNEMLVGVTIPEKPGSFKKFCLLIGKRSITEFNYRYSDAKKAHVFAGIKLSNGIKEKNSVLKRLRESDYKVVDFSDNEMAKLHVRYMVGGISKSDHTEYIFRFVFPEKPGELYNFLDTIGSEWNISLFHYRNHGADFGRVLIGFQASDSDKKLLVKHLNSLNYEFFEETYNKAYNLFLS